jgi:uncharacterized membrane protein YqiK
MMTSLFLLADFTIGDAMWLAIPIAFLVFVAFIVGIRYIPNDRIGIVEKLWSNAGSVKEGHIIARGGEAGYQADLLRGGMHPWYWRWQYKIHNLPLVTVPQGKIAYVYARDGEPLEAGQTLARIVNSNHFQDASGFIIGTSAAYAGAERGAAGASPALGQRGRQRAILREGVYAINLALFVVISEDFVYHLPQSRGETEKLQQWQAELRDAGGFDPTIIGRVVELPDPLNPGKSMAVDSIGIVTVQDGPSLAPGEIIAPSVGNVPTEPDYHNNYQDPEAFLRAGGRRGRQYVPLTDGTYFLNRWFATVETCAKTVVPIGYVGVVVSYYGPVGTDVSGESFRHGERVARGERGVWERPLGPGKYPFNPYAGQIILVPTTNFVLHWITGRSESHRYDEGLKSIDIVTKDAYEPMLPLSIVVNIDYMKAPSVIQRFGDVKKLITQTLDPMLSAYFRDVSHQRTMLELLQKRDVIQSESKAALREKFSEFDIECVDVLIGKPDTAEAGGKIETLLEQLRMRQLSIEQLETFERQRQAAEEQRKLNEAQALAAKQKELTDSQVQIRIAENAGDADLSRARKMAQQQIVMAEAELEKSRRQAEQTIVTAKAEAEQRQLAGQGEGKRLMQIGLAEATVLMRKVSSYGDPRLFALTQAAEKLSQSAQPLVPEKVFTAGGSNGKDGDVNGANGLLGTLIALMVAEKSGFQMTEAPELGLMKDFAEKMSKEAMTSLSSATTEGNGRKI